MAKMIGTKPNQVPSNADLGTAAFMDAKEFLLAKGSDLSAIDNIVSKTARRLFIYDTSQDSDGGAWRHRCEHTSWYNEELNTPYRGSRREFPSVALIVLEDGYVHIYDADSPSLELWMTFVGASGNMYGAVTGGQPQNAHDVHMLNGELVWGVPVGNAQGPIRINFISEDIFWYYTNIVYKIVSPISKRNTDVEINSVENAEYLNNASIRTIDMKVLKNAPINPKTGLPAPTIALGTDDGISIIRDFNDGEVESNAITNLNYNDTYTGSSFVEFNDNDELVFSAQQSSSQQNYYTLCILPLPGHNVFGSSSDPWRNLMNTYGGRAYESPVLTTRYNNVNLTRNSYTDGGSSIQDGATTPDGFALAYNGQLTKVKELNQVPNSKSEDTGSVAYITADYNTGYMTGDIQMATLVDTVNGVINDNDLDITGTGYYLDNWTQSGTQLISNYSGTNFIFNVTEREEIGRNYVIEFDVTAYTSGTVSVSFSTGGTTHGPFSGTGSYRASGVTTGNNRIYIRGDNFVGTVDNVKVYEVIEDRSFGHNGLRLHGELFRESVANGADLVGYSGFSQYHYLKQPYSDRFDRGNGDFSHTMWIKSPDPSAFGCLMHRSATQNGDGTWIGSGHIQQIEFNTTNLRAGCWGDAFGGGYFIDVSDDNFNPDVWHQIVFLRRNAAISELWVDGVLKGSIDYHQDNGVAQDTNNSSGELWVGNRPDVGNRPFNGSIALYRFSGTAPTADQIKEIYNEEKELFKENAKCTIYGQSSSIEGIAYDHITDHLHVGTSVGRSTFKGLRRIENTKRPIANAISAVNGFVAEE